MSEEIIELRCPKCGDYAIKEWSKVEAAQDIYNVTRDEHGELQIGEYGNSEFLYEYAEELGYACSNFCEGDVFPLEHYVPKGA